MLSLVGVRQRVSQLTHSYGRFTHTHTLYTHLLVMTTYTQCVWEREMADLAGSALETESRKTVRTPAKRQQQWPQQHPVVATAAAVHTGARHQCIPVNMQQQCVASIHTHMHIHTYMYMHVYISERESRGQLLLYNKKANSWQTLTATSASRPALSRPRKSCACVWESFLPALSLTFSFLFVQLHTCCWPKLTYSRSPYHVTSHCSPALFALFSPALSLHLEVAGLPTFLLTSMSTSLPT